MVLFGQGHVWQGIFLLVWSLALTSSADNIIKPWLVRGDTEIPAVFIVLGVFGGLATLGPVGALLGPVILAFVRALLAIYEERYLVLEPPDVDSTGFGDPSGETPVGSYDPAPRPT